MTEIVALFKQFIYRDLAFIFGGSIVLLSLAYAFRGWIGPIDWQNLDWEKFPPASIIFLIGAAAYIIGYAVQDVGGVLRLTPTGRLQPGCLLRRLYECFSRVSWKDPNYPNNREFEFEIRLGRLGIPEDVLQALERIRSLKVISMCVGGCLALSVVIFLIQLPFNFNRSSVAINSVIFTVSLLLAACLICLGRIKGMQEMQFYQSIYEEFPEKQTGAIKWGATLERFTINKD